MSADVYFVQCGVVGPIKIGSAGDVTRRVAALQTGTPERLRVIARAPGVGVEGERELHRRFAHRRIRGEWFRPSPDLLNFAAWCRVHFRRRVIDVPEIDEYGRVYVTSKASDQLTWTQLEEERAHLLAAAVAYRDNVYIESLLLELRELATGTATPDEAARSIGTTVDAWLDRRTAV